MKSYLFNKPLSELLRPTELNNYYGQEQIIGKNTLLNRMISTDDYSSFILWGPPGSGKTSIAKIIQRTTSNNFISMSAVTTGIKEIKDIMKKVNDDFGLYQNKTILFIDEIHRFNKAQQDAFLSYVEQGSIVLLGATTENPSFSVIAPLLSRMRVFIVKPLDQETLSILIDNALKKIHMEINKEVIISLNEKNAIIAIANGDARRALGMLEMAVKLAYTEDAHTITIDKKIIEKATQGRFSSYDKLGDYHYDYLSALHKSMRNSDVDAALYYATVMLEAGEAPQQLLRRIIQCASEDIGLADPQALVISTQAHYAFQSLGLPEATLSILQAVAYNSLAPKSNAIYQAYQLIKQDIKNHPDASIPLHLRNAVTPLMKEAGYGDNYQYAHDLEIPIAKMQCLPEKLKNRRYYKPKNFGFERELAKRLDSILAMKTDSPS